RNFCSGTSFPWSLARISPARPGSSCDSGTCNRRCHTSGRCVQPCSGPSVTALFSGYLQSIVGRRPPADILEGWVDVEATGPSCIPGTQAVDIWLRNPQAITPNNRLPVRWQIVSIGNNSPFPLLSAIVRSLQGSRPKHDVPRPSSPL